MGRKSKSKRFPSSSQSPSPSSTTTASATATDEQVEAIVIQCIEAQKQLAQGKSKSGMKLLKKALNKYANYGIVHRVSASMILDLTDNGDDLAMNVHNKYMIFGLDCAKKAVELEPNCVEYVLFFATSFLKVAESVKDFEVLRRLCGYALMVEDPVDLHDLIMTVHRFSEGGRLAAVRRELEALIEKMKDLEEKERVKEVERSRAEAALEENADSSANEADENCEPSFDDLIAKLRAAFNLKDTGKSVANTSVESAPNDGTDLSEPALPALSWEELIQYINQRLEDFSTKTTYLGV